MLQKRLARKWLSDTIDNCNSAAFDKVVVLYELQCDPGNSVKFCIRGSRICDVYFQMATLRFALWK